MSELSNDDKKAIWMFVDVMAKVLDATPILVKWNSKEDIRVNYIHLVDTYALKYGIDPQLITESVKRYVTDQTVRNIL